MSGRLAGRVVVITGGAEGIGRSCALAYAEAGARVVIGDIREEAGEAVVVAIRSGGGEARFLRSDAGRSAECRALVQHAVDAYGGVDVLHANAGMELCKTVWDTSDEDWERVIAVNLGGAFHAARAAMLAMRARGTGGVVLMTASPHAFVTSREIAAYAASKGGMVALMRAMALEGAPFGIRANALLPGAIETPMLHREAAGAPDPAALLRQFAQAHPLNRLGTPEDIARVAVFLASDDAAFMTGACVAVDGGLMAVANSGPIISYTGG
jgi:NAD(P)-dependent dehydrogenase (short-subunit alcohol dehydrogenase family)